MPKPASSNPNGSRPLEGTRQSPNWWLAVACAALGLFLLVGLLAYEPMQSSMHSTAPVPKNPTGKFGANFLWVMLFSVGFSTWLIPVFLLWSAYTLVRTPRHVTTARVAAMVVACISLSALLAMMNDARWGSDYFPQGYGGWFGVTLYHRMMSEALGAFGSFLLFGMIYIGAQVFVFTQDIGAEFERVLAAMRAWREDRAKAREAALELQKQQREDERRRATAAVAAAAAVKTASATEKPAKPVEAAAPKKPIEPKPEPEPEKIPLFKPTPKAETATDTKALAVNAAGRVELNIVKPEAPKKAAKVSLPQSDDANYEFPPLKLLRDPVKPTAANSEEEHRQNAENLLRILSEFGVEVTLGEIHVGPVITRYEVVPAPGVRVEKIANLDKNIALGMKAQSVRILAPIPGKAAVGVEVPNQQPTPVGMRELLESEDWASAKAEIPIALGKDVSGKPLVSDLSKMPHLLIAGATGSGKSVCINSVVASIIYSKSPKDLRLIMVDPKVVELKIFNTLPHMLIPVVTEPKKVPAALKWLLKEMEQRYKIFAKVNVRNIIGFNGRKKGVPDDAPAAPAQPSLEGIDPLSADDEIEVPDHLPYIVAIIDELADLMMVSPAEIETNIARLAQLARAAGIHLIIATQRPSVNVITGVIKANLPSRIAFQVASQVDSRTILDTKGADTLIGRGDMLFSPPGSSRLVRAQGAFVSDEEVQQMVEFLKRNGPPQYAQSVQQQIDHAAREEDEGEDGEDGDLGDDEQLYKQAIDVLKATKRASTSMLQRKLKIGYNRAARIVEIMEERGVVGPENGSSPREILVDLDAM
jgi:S-DNA-T family DNA segregation ATPase FtsK/SpoIIIE